MRGGGIAEERATSLAIMLLTRARGVEVQRSRSLGLDLEVYLPKPGRVFAVEVKARLNEKTLGTFAGYGRLRLSSELRTSLRKKRERLGDCPFPVLVICFAMQSDAGFFGWLRDPRKPTLTAAPLDQLDKWVADTHLRIMAEVNKWYDGRAR